MLPDSLQPDLQLWNGSSEACGALQATRGTVASTNAVQQEPLLGLDPIVRALQGLGLLQMDTKQLEELLMQQQDPTQPPQQQQQWQQQKQQQQAQPFVSDVAASPLDASWQTLAEAMAQQSPADVNLASLDYAAFAQQQQQEAQKQQQQALWALSSGLSPAGLAGMSPPHDLTPLLQRDLHSNMLQSELRSNVPAGPPGLDVGLRQAFSQPMQESHTVLSGDALAQRLFGGGVAGSMPAPHMSLNHAPRPYRQHAPNPYGAMRNIGSSARERMLLQAAQQLPVSAAPSAAPRAPVWNKPTWDRMGVVPGAGHKVSTGTGVFIPKTSMPAASSAAGAGAGVRSEPAMAVAQLHDASSGRGFGPVGGMGVGARS